MRRAALLSLWAVGCGAKAPADTGVSMATTSTTTSTCLPTWDGWADGFFATWCRSCHSATAPDRHGAPDGTDLDTEAQALALADRIHARVVVEGTMPLGGGVVEDDLTLLDAWLACARPEAP